MSLSFQELIIALQRFWSERGCLVGQPCNTEVGAGTFNPHTFLRVLGSRPWKAAYVEPSRRPSDGRYGDNPNRLQQFNQYQVILKPAIGDVQDVYLESLQALGIVPVDHDIRFVEDNWESPTLGASGLGWEVWLDGLEITQFTYFQRAGGFDLDPVSVELTYGLERIAMFLQSVDNVFDLEYGAGVPYREVHHLQEREWSAYNFEEADVDLHVRLFDDFEAQAMRLLERTDEDGTPAGLVLPAYDFCLKCSHVFNVLDARGAISVSERQRYIGRVQKIARRCAVRYVELVT
ncbi:MAG: glycine--tRNA ligase subunit alpha [Deltaproteobacteria bacterium]|nr:glycine--tRNA ligase subunit alpha [Deltaproteobacteria bacterium]